MRKTLGLVVAAGIFASAAMGANLNVSVESGGSNTITAAPGETVDYRVMGQLDTDADNRGLALVGFDLELLNEGTSTQAAALPQADEPTSVNMLNFAVPEGINNPAGFGGTDSSGKLLQVGGAQNTINNTLDCTVNDDCPGASNLCESLTCTASAPFPLGTVIENLGHTEIELAKGSFTVPSNRGGACYVLTLTDLFANVISTTQNSPDFLATEAAGAGTIANLTICTCATASVLATNPTEAQSLWRTKKNIMRFTLDNDVTAPVAGEVEIRECQANCTWGPDQSGDFDISMSSPNVLRMQEIGDVAHLNHRSWYKVSNAAWACVAPFEYKFLVAMGDTSGNKVVQNADLSLIFDGIPGFVGDDSRLDVDGNRAVQNADLSLAFDHIGGFPPAMCCP